MIEETLKILIVDDTSIIRDALKIQLEGIIANPVVEEAENGLMAIQKLKTFSPDIIFMDVSMPIMNGIEATKKIMQEFPKMKIIGFSMNDETSVVESLKSAGAQSFLIKTSSAEKMEAVVKEVLVRK